VHERRASLAARSQPCGQVEFAWDSDTAVVVTAARPIAAGEELTMEYIDTEQPVKRQPWNAETFRKQALRLITTLLHI
jgi:hypothetical protein